MKVYLMGSLVVMFLYFNDDVGWDSKDKLRSVKGLAIDIILWPYYLIATVVALLWLAVLIGPTNTRRRGYG